METKKRLHLFEAFGVELEYMIVGDESLNVLPVADVLLRDADGNVEGEVEHGDVAWSNELVSHVIEIKSNGPKTGLVQLEKSFHENVLKINGLLESSGAKLLSGAAHPWMNPLKETKLWEHESSEIYESYDRIFNCKGHGWSNLQSTHINLPFYDDEEFSKLHTAIRFLMPLIPGLTASSPILNGQFTGYYDRRLYYYELNQAKIPVLTGKVVPERVFTKHGYQKQIYDKISTAILPYDPDHILNPVWLNSRGAMARFDRGAIEIRIIDIQECPKADMAVVALLVTLIKILVKGQWISFETQQSFGTSDLQQILRAGTKDGSKTQLVDQAYLHAFGFDHSVSYGQVWQSLLTKAVSDYPQYMSHWVSTLADMVEHGTLAERIVRKLDGNYSRDHLKAVYEELAKCLTTNTVFL